MLRLVIILVQLAAETVRWWGLAGRSQQSIEAENLFLRRQLALYIERGVKPRRIDSVTRITLVLLSRFCNWRDALVVGLQGAGVQNQGPRHAGRHGKRRIRPQLEGRGGDGRAGGICHNAVGGAGGVGNRFAGVGIPRHY